MPACRHQFNRKSHKQRRAEMAADGYRWLHLRATQRGGVALRGTRGISAEGVNSEGPTVLSSIDRCDKLTPHSIIISGYILFLNPCGGNGGLLNKHQVHPIRTWSNTDHQCWTVMVKAFTVVPRSLKSTFYMVKKFITNFIVFYYLHHMTVALLLLLYILCIFYVFFIFYIICQLLGVVRLFEICLRTAESPFEAAVHCKWIDLS